MNKLKPKTEVETAIQELPLAEQRKVFIETTTGNGVTRVTDAWAICDVGTDYVHAFVSPTYTLVQHRDLFNVVVNGIEDYAGYIIYHDGNALLNVFPEGNEFVLDSGERIGITAYNSVNKTSGVGIRFIIANKEGKVFMIPKRVAVFNLPHIGKVSLKMKDLIAFTHSVKVIWGTICEKFTTIEVKPEEVRGWCKSLGAGDRVADKLVGYNQTMNLWELSMSIYDHFTTKKYTSELHRRERIDQFTESMFTVSLGMDL